MRLAAILWLLGRGYVHMIKSTPQWILQKANLGTKVSWTAAASPQWQRHHPLDLRHQRLRWNTHSFAATETCHWGYYDSPSQSAAQTAWSLTVGHVCGPCIKYITNFPIPAIEIKVGIDRRDMNVWRLMLVIVAWPALAHKSEMHGEPVFDIVWYCQPDRMGHGP